MPFAKNAAKEKSITFSRRVYTLTWFTTGPIGFFPVTIATTPSGRNGLIRVMWIRAHFQNVLVRRSSLPSTPTLEKFFPKTALTFFNTGKPETRSMI